MIDITNDIIHMHNDHISLVFTIENKRLLMRYLGKPIRHYHQSMNLQHYKREFNTQHEGFDPKVSFDDLPFVYPVAGHGDYRIPALQVSVNGTAFCDLYFKSAKLLNHKPALPHLPATRDGECLALVLEDPYLHFEIHLYYTLYPEGIITASAMLVNSDQDLTIDHIQSVSLDLSADSYQLMSLYGLHAKEANLQEVPLPHGITRLSSTRGCSSPHTSDFAALISPHQVIAITLAYSGNFAITFDHDSFGKVRMQAGLNSDTFSWHLAPHERFYTPEAIINIASDIDTMTQQFHTFFQEHLFSPRHHERYVLLNSWEAMYYDVSMTRILKQVEKAQELGIELFVLDDGWFRKGLSSHDSMGDYQVNTNKLPDGITGVAKLVHAHHMKFGLWFEPEAIGKISQLITDHPEYVLHVPGYTLTQGRHEYLLDLSRQDVREHIMTMLSGYLDTHQIDYIKWDMNRPMSDVGSGEKAHRYILGLYEILEEITSRYPEVIFEGCASGGARLDPGMLYYMDQNWSSDNTDAHDRYTIEQGFSLLYPPKTLGAHVSTVPNHQTARLTPWESRFHMACLFNLGYELDLTQLSDQESAQMKKDIAFYKSIRYWDARLIQCDQGFEWVKKDQSEAVIVLYVPLYNPLLSQKRYRIKGLNPQLDYYDVQTQKYYGGDELYQIGLSLPLVREDFHTVLIHLKAIG